MKNDTSAPQPPSPTTGGVPLCVDLDGTLIGTDTMWEAMLWLVKCNPLNLLSLFWWWARGRAHLKRQLAARARIDIAALPYHAALIQWLRQEKASGRRLILVTASDQSMGERVAAHVHLFDEVIGSNGRENLRGHTKRRRLNERFGKGGYDYAGNSSVDLQVWPDVRAAIVVNARASVLERARRLAPVEQVFGPPPG
ncbi:MAG: haloacid dehalogenase-like hydrolase [Verrucomicrobia bacterium]|nr:haloacid dehalogenase-like hydrolase [Verrucomicrobiota bacterium]